MSALGAKSGSQVPLRVSSRSSKLSGVPPGGPGPRVRDQRGSAVLTGAVAIAFLLLLFVAGLNFTLDEYAKGAVHTAVDDAAQAGAAAGGSVSSCQVEADRVRANLLPGPFGSGVTISCALRGNSVVATASGTLLSMVPAVPRLNVAVVGISAVEQGPFQ